MEQAKKNLREAVDEKAKDLWAKYDADKKPVSIPIDKADKDEAAIAEVNTQEKINPTPVVEAPVVAPEGNNPIRSSIDIAMEKTDHLVEKKPAVKVSPEDDKNQEIKKFWEEEGQHIWAEGKANVQLPTPEAVIAPDLAQPEILEAKTEALVLASQEKENKLKGDLDRARFNYAMADFKANNVLEKIKSVLRIKTDSKNISEVSDAYKYYTDCARALMEFQMKEMERKGLSGETLDKKTAEIVKYFNFDERMNLFDTYNQARAKTIEEKFGKAPGWAMEQGAKFLNWYRKQDWKRKALFGYGVAIIGGGTAVLGMRALGSAAAGYGFVAGREASYRKQEQQKATEEQSQILTQAEKIGEDKFKSIIASLETGIGDYDKKLSIEKREKLKRLGVGVALGATIFALGTAASKMGIGRYIMEKVGWIEHQPEVHFPTAKTSNLEAAVDHHLNQSNQVPEITARGDEMADKAQQAFEKAQAEAAANAPGAVPGGEEMIQTQLGPEDLASGATPENLSEKMVDLAVEKGSSVEGSIIKYLANNPDIIDRYNELSGGRGFDAGQIAHRMASDFAHSHGIDFDKLNHVLPGQEIAINPDGMEIKEVPGFSGTETLDSKGFSLMKKVYGLNIDNWRQIKNLTWDKVQGQLSPDSETYKNIQKLIAEQGKTLGEAAKPQSNETIPTWVARLAKLSVNK